MSHFYLILQGKNGYTSIIRRKIERPGKKVTWPDDYGNFHDLDYVLEINGGDHVMGSPVGFIEVAWRRYTKHSRNKAQEIQGAILPLAEKYKWNNPFLGAVLSGNFTEGSLEQLRSHGFQVLYIPYDTLVESFAREKIDIAFDEKTPDTDFKRCVEKIQTTSMKRMKQIKAHLIRENREKIDEFMASLYNKLARIVETVIIIPLYGESSNFMSIQDAMAFINQHTAGMGSLEFREYKIFIQYSNGDRVEGSFQSKMEAIEFLRFLSDRQDKYSPRG